HVATGLGLRVEGGERLQRPGGQHRAGPGAEVLRREGLPRHLVEILVDIARVDTPMDARLGLVLEQLLSGKFLTATDDPGQAPIAEGDGMAHPTLATKAE